MFGREVWDQMLSTRSRAVLFRWKICSKASTNIDNKVNPTMAGHDYLMLCSSSVTNVISGPEDNLSVDFLSVIRPGCVGQAELNTNHAKTLA
jgi:hypothetical protein